MYRGDNKANYPLLVIISHTFVFVFAFVLLYFALFLFPFFILFCPNGTFDLFSSILIDFVTTDNCIQVMSHSCELLMVSF